jgi:putative mRNA 3-end processing factor
VSGDQLLHLTDSGLYCPPGDFHIDPWRPVERAVVTHAHSDHARRGSACYLAARPGLRLLRSRLGDGAAIDGLDYGEAVEVRGVRVSLHPAGHVLGSAQVRVEHRGQVWVVSGDFKLAADPTCAPFEPVRCHTFVTESTFGLPVYRWPDPEEVMADINAWWRQNRDDGRATLLFGYALGKAQRLLAGLDPSVGPIFTHGAVEKLNRDYRDSGVALPPTTYVGDVPRGTGWAGALVVAPPSAHGSPWARRFGAASTGFASGWMRIRGTRRRRAVDRGFVLSDHADWPGLLDAIRATGAGRVWVTHGYVGVLVRWLREQGIEAEGLQTRFEGEQDETGDEPSEGAEGVDA